MSLPHDAQHFLTCPPLLILVPAHNEESGLAATLQSLLSCRHAVIVVIADNCTDDTAAIAHHMGVRVLERNDLAFPGKPYALSFALDLLKPENYLYIAVVDADTVVSPNFAEVILHKFQQGAPAVQVRYAHQATDFTLWQRLADIGFDSTNTLRPLGRQYWHFSCGILGNGFALTKETLERVPFQSTSLVEDLAYHLELVYAGIVVHFTAETTVYAKMPTSRRGMQTQRTRWEAGRLALVKSKLPLLLRHFLAGHFALAEPLLDLLLPPLAFYVLPLCLLLFLPLPYVHVYAWLGLSIVGLYCITTLLIRKNGWKDWMALAVAPLFVLWKLSLIPRLLKTTSTWVRTDRN